MGFKSLLSRKKKSSPSSTSEATATPFTSATATPQAIRSPSFNTGAQIAELEQVFNKFDVNGDGEISSMELFDLCPSTRSCLRC
jgi:Ca2+-binding EF-hand superfamily protein